jgi:hypothetical protein
MSDLTTGWRKRQIALDIKAENARELGLDYEPSKTVMEMARDAAAMHGHTFKDVPEQATIEFITAFEALIRADEREACERAIEELLPDADRGDCAAAIRSRGQA